MGADPVLVVPHMLSAQSAVAQVTPKEIRMHVYISIPALDHMIFKYAGYQSEDSNANNEWHRKNGITGSGEEVAAGPYRVLVVNEYLGDRIDADLQPYGEPADFVPRQVVITRKLGDTVLVHMWMRRTYPGDDDRFRRQTLSNGGMLHTFQLDETEACSKAIAQHIEIELARKGLEERVAKWRQDR